MAFGPFRLIHSLTLFVRAIEPARASLSSLFMVFLAFAIQPAAGAAVGTSRVQLPVAGRSAFASSDIGRVNALLPAAAADRDQPRGALAGRRTQYRAQCRANCMTKANF